MIREEDFDYGKLFEAQPVKRKRRRPPRACRGSSIGVL
jgi:hypothetical protein